MPSLLQRVDERSVLFESWHGKLADSPRAIAEELSRRGSSLQQLWVVGDPADRVPEGSVAVLADSGAYLAALGGTGWIVSNNTLPGYFRKKRATSFLQTWHGTPLKRIAFDLRPNSAAASSRYLRHLAREVESWDFLVSPNRFSTVIFREAFRFRGEILETGYPRNDLLSLPAGAAVREQVRAQLGIPAETQALLYAPTWRDGDPFSFPRGLAERAREAGQTILLRTHQLVGPLAGLEGHAGLIDVSAFPDIRELYLAADALITDYSSAMFDFAVTGKPILLFVYDLDRYRDELRGFYFDFEAEAPGPLLRTTGEVIEAMTSLGEVASSHRGAYARFRQRFCHLDDGHAAARVVDAVFGEAAVG